MGIRPTVDGQLSRLIAPLRADELAGLEASLKSEGCRDALIVWKEKGILLDGHNRLVICERENISYRMTDISLPDRLAAEIWLRQNQAARRNLTDGERAMNGAALADLFSQQAKRERAKAGRAAGGEATPEQKTKRLETDATPKRSKPKAERSRSKAAKAVRVSERKIRQAQEVRKAAPDLAAKVERGEIELPEAVRTIRREALRAGLEEVSAREIEAPTGLYDVIVIDPPWPMEKIERDCRPNQTSLDYPTMTQEQLCELRVPADDNCHLFLWTTQRFLPVAFMLLDAWEFRYVCTFVWHKPGGFQPIGLPQYDCEFALYARRGSPKFIDTKGFRTCFDAPRGGHSEKPETFYETLRRVTGGRRLDMFSRRKIEGFTAWGNEAP
jgi:N6-adenosine-specific RNA methylase IME4